jgi:hypothetical protein
MKATTRLDFRPSSKRCSTREGLRGLHARSEAARLNARNLYSAAGEGDLFRDAVESRQRIEADLSLHDTNRGGLDRHSDNGGAKIAAERPAAISGLAGSARKFLAAVRRAL